MCIRDRLKGARWEGFKSGDKTLTDSWSDTVDPLCGYGMGTVSYTHLRAHETVLDLVCRLLLETKK